MKWLEPIYGKTLPLRINPDDKEMPGKVRIVREEKKPAGGTLGVS
jgi:hypothetical protein